MTPDRASKLGRDNVTGDLVIVPVYLVFSLVRVGRIPNEYLQMWLKNSNSLTHSHLKQKVTHFVWLHYIPPPRRWIPR